MDYFFVLGIGYLIGWYFTNKSNQPNSNLPPPPPPNNNLRLRIIAELNKSASPEITKVLQELLREEPSTVPLNSLQAATTLVKTPAGGSIPAAATNVAPAPVLSADVPIPMVPLDPAPAGKGLIANLNLDVQFKKSEIDTSNTSMLLYFGAFLFLTSVGLFIRFAQIDGTIRTGLVGSAAITIYALGFYLWKNMPKVQQAGEAFIGIGMVMVPLVGLAAYNFIFDQSNGDMVWLTTSLVALGVYVHTIVRLRSTFVSYMLLGSTISLFESVAGVVDGPLYYYTWILAFSGIALQILSLKVKDFPELKEPAAISSQLLLPVSLIGSFLLVGDSGFWQLAVSLTLAAAYYGLQTQLNPDTRIFYFGLSHVLALAAVSVGAYSINESAAELRYSLIGLTLLHLPVLALIKEPRAELPKQTADIALIFSGIAVAFSITDRDLISVSTAVFVLVAALIAYRFRSFYALVSGSIAWLSLSVLIGQVTLDENLNGTRQAVLTFAMTLPVYCAAIITAKDQLSLNARLLLQSLIIAGTSVALLSALTHDMVALIIIASSSFILSMILSEYSKDNFWAKAGLVYLSVPVLVSFIPNLFSIDKMPTITTAIILVASILVALRYKLEDARWLSTGAWVIMPLALLLDDYIVTSYDSSGFIALNIVAVIALSISRAIARGKILDHNKVPLASLAKSSSQAYLTGMAVSSMIAIILIIGSTAIAIPSLLLIGLVSVLVIHGLYIEKDLSYTALVPLASQLVLFKLVNPYYGSETIASLDRDELFISMSLTLATALFVASYSSLRMVGKADKFDLTLKVVLATVFIAPASVLFMNGETFVAMPIGLIVGSILLLEYARMTKIANKELIGGLGTLGIFWLMHFYGVRNVQAYSHVLASIFAVYAVRRHYLGQSKQSDDYILVALITSTLPLVIEALGGQNQGLYATWLLLEQTAFMLLGVTIRKPLLTKWGLGVAVGVVLYQLRNFGWALLALMSVVIIGLAIYRLVKAEESKK